MEPYAQHAYIKIVVIQQNCLSFQHNYLKIVSKPNAFSKTETPNGVS